MLGKSKAFSGFSVGDVPRAKEFYSQTLGLEVTEENGMLTLHIAGDRHTLIYLPVTFARTCVRPN